MSAAFLYGLVVFSAIANSVWNALVKSAGDRTLTMVAIRVAGLGDGTRRPAVRRLAGARELEVAGAHGGGACSATTRCLIRSYGLGDMSVVYPLARGIAPVLTTVAAFLVIGEAA